MSTFTKVKLGFALVGITIFFLGVRYDDGRLRNVAIGCVAVAWVMRFVRPKSTSTTEHSTDHSTDT